MNNKTLSEMFRWLQLKKKRQTVKKQLPRKVNSQLNIIKNVYIYYLVRNIVNCHLRLIILDINW